MVPFQGTCFLLPIREAYEWKHDVRPVVPPQPTTCFQFVKRMNGNLKHSFFRSIVIVLLPIREAYEWKHGFSGHFVVAIVS